MPPNPCFLILDDEGYMLTKAKGRISSKDRDYGYKWESGKVGTPWPPVSSYEPWNLVISLTASHGLEKQRKPIVEVHYSKKVFGPPEKFVCLGSSSRF
jgi:hypothetical protein